METLSKVIEDLILEAGKIQNQDRDLRPEEMVRVRMINQALPHLDQALDILSEEVASTLITYKIVSNGYRRSA
jgi:hypothetical protein